MLRKLFAVMAVGIAPAFAQTGPLTPVEQSPLAKDAFSTGLLGRDSGALGADLWRGADAESLRLLLEHAPSRPASPSIGDALRRVLVSPGEAPADATPALGGAKLVALVRAGFIDEARQIESLASGTEDDLKSAEAMATVDILSNEIAAACDTGRRIADARDPFWVKLRVVCYAAANELDAAELALAVLRDSGSLSELDEAILTPLTAGGKPKAGAGPVDALHYAAMKIAKAPIGAEMLADANGGVVRAIANDPSADWPARLDAAKLSAAMGVMPAAELRKLFAAAPPEAAADYKAISAMTAPELLRDKAARIAAEISKSADFPSLYAAAILYADEIAALAGGLLEPAVEETFALARLAAGDAAGAEKWLAAALTGATGVAPQASPRFTTLVSILAVLDSAAAKRAATAANVAIQPLKRGTNAAASPRSDPALPVLVGAAIDAAANASAGMAALAALAASDAAARGDAVAAALLEQSLRVAGLTDIVNRRLVEQSIATTFPATAKAAEVVATPAPAPTQTGIVPRLKPKRAS